MIIDRQIVSGDSGGTISMDTSREPSVVALPTPVDGFNVTVKDGTGNAGRNPIKIIRSATNIKIDGETNDDVIAKSGGAISYLAFGGEWFRVSNFAPVGVIGIFAGGFNSVALNDIEYINIVNESAANDWGDTSVASYYGGGCGSSVRGLRGSLYTTTDINTIDFVTYSTKGTAKVFGTLTSARRGGAVHSSPTRGLFAGGANSGGDQTQVDYVTIVTEASAASFGNLANGRSYPGGTGNQTRMLIIGSTTFPGTSEYIIMANLTSVSPWGTLLTAGRFISTASSRTRAVFATMVDTPVNTIEYYEMSQNAQSQDFGDLIRPRNIAAAVSNRIRGVFGGGNGTPALPKETEFVNIATKANSKNFGELTLGKEAPQGFSSGHGGA